MKKFIDMKWHEFFDEIFRRIFLEIVGIVAEVSVINQVFEGPRERFEVMLKEF